MKVTADITDDDIRELRDGPGFLDAALREICRVALRSGTPTGHHPFCRVCSWRKGGPDSWNGSACKCGLRAQQYHTCDRCSGLGSVPYDVGSQPRPSCDGSGLIDPEAAVLAREACAAYLARHGAAS